MVAQLPMHNILGLFSFGTKAGKVSEHRWKTNQDELISVSNVLGMPHVHFFAVCDGHGVNGHYIARKIKEDLPKFLTEELS